MSVRLLIGRTGSGKTTFCINEMKEQMMEEPDGDPIIYLVPDQMTFLSEYKLISTPELGGMIRAQVYSFSRLAWRILQEEGGISRYHLNHVGINMLIRKVVEENKEYLKLFGRAADKNGFIGQMEQILTEFKRYCVSPEELHEKQFAFDEKNERVLRDKLHDLELIYKSFEEALFNKYIDSEDYLKLLGEKIPLSSYLKKSQVYVDGFHSFAPQEYMIVGQLMKHCKKVTIALTLDIPFHKQAPDELHLFRMTGETCQTIYEMAKVEGISIEEIFFHRQERWKHESLRHLEANFHRLPPVPYENKPFIQIAQAQNRRAEIEGTARTIIKLVRDEGYRYKDVALLIRNGEEYRDIIATIFADYDIPIFFDRKKLMLNHPLIELIRSVLEVINGYWRYEPIFRTVKTELLFPLEKNTVDLREKMDRLENYCLACGIQGDKWTKKDRWKYHRYRGLELENAVQTDTDKAMEDEINELRKIISEPILKLSRNLRKAGNGRQLCEALYFFLEELHIPAKLEKWKLAEEEKGNLIKAREHDQVWNAVMELLDQFVEILGDEKVTLKQFAKILDAGMESMHFSLVPPAIDQVIAADLEKSRLSDIKIAFVLGLNEGVLPAKYSDEGLLADDDRETLLRMGLKISPSSRTKLLDEEFLAYCAFSTPSDRLFVSYPLADEEGKALMPSFYIKRLTDLFPEIREEKLGTDPSELSGEEQIEYIVCENTVLSYLSAQLQLKKRNYPIHELWWDVYNYYINSPKWKPKAMKVLSSLNYRNGAKNLSKKVSQELYGDAIQASVSRMEQFSACPFSHFAQYGLNLKERPIFRLEPPGIGELFHGALKYIVETVMAQHQSWHETTKEEVEQIAKEAVNLLAPKLTNEILLSSGRNHYIKRKLEQIITRASIVLREQANRSCFSPVGLELGFGKKEKLPPMKFSLNNGTRMELVGRIDRVDMAKEENSIYLRVVDYKSGAKDLDLNEVYYGLALQMLTYLDIVITNAPILIGTRALPAGVLYFHVHNPIVNTARELTFEELENELLKKFKMTGLVLGDVNVVKMMDHTIDSGDSSIVAVGLKKDGTLSGRSKVADKEEFKLLSHYVRNMYVKTGNQIVDGVVKISPYKMKGRTACTFCPFKPVCQFDESMGENEYRVLSYQPKDKLIKNIRKEEGEHEKSSNSAKA